jgi:hypothetical protein
MSRRCHHGSPRHVPLGRIPRRPAATSPERHPATAFTAAPGARTSAAPGTIELVEPVEPVEPAEPVEPVEPAERVEATEHAERVEPTEQARPVAPAVAHALAGDIAPVAPAGPRDRGPHVPRHGAPRSIAGPLAPLEAPRAAREGEDASVERAATAPQLRRFIKSRAYVPMHELRRRFGINGADDEVTPVDLERRRVFVGLPEREGRLLGELLRAGDIGYELSLDPISPIVVGVYPMRPVTRA